MKETPQILCLPITMHNMVSMFVSPLPPNAYVEIPMPSVMVLESGIFGRCLSHQGEALMNGISVLFIKQTPGSSLTPSTM